VDDSKDVMVLTGPMWLQVSKPRRACCTYAIEWSQKRVKGCRRLRAYVCLRTRPMPLGMSCPCFQHPSARLQVEDPAAQSLKVQVRDSHLTGRTVLGHVTVPLRQLPADCTLDAWLPVEGVDGGRAGEVHLQLTYKVLPCDLA